MDTVIYDTLLTVNFVAIGMIFIKLVKWNKGDIRITQHIVPTILFAVADIGGLAAGLFYVPIFLPSLGVVLLGIKIRKDQWPDLPEFEMYHWYFVHFLAFCLIPGLALLGIMYPFYLRDSGLGVYVDVVDYIFLCMFALIPFLVFIFSHPLNRKKRRDPLRMYGAGLGLGGAILGITLMFFLQQGLVGEALAILFSIVSLVAALLLFLPPWWRPVLPEFST